MRAYFIVPLVDGLFHLRSLISVELQAECKFNRIYCATSSSRDCALGVLSKDLFKFLYIVFIVDIFDEVFAFKQFSLAVSNLLILLESRQDVIVLTPSLFR